MMTRTFSFGLALAFADRSDWTQVSFLLPFGPFWPFWPESDALADAAIGAANARTATAVRIDPRPPLPQSALERLSPPRPPVPHNALERESRSVPRLSLSLIH